jgi:regulator of replication initiation timing
MLITFEDHSAEAALQRQCENLVDELERARHETVDAQSAIDAAHEELQTTNEELQVMNEELRERLQQLDDATVSRTPPTARSPERHGRRPSAVGGE